MSRTGVRVDGPLLRRRLSEQSRRESRLRSSLVRQLSLPEAAADSPKPWTTGAGLAAFARLVVPGWPARPDGMPQITLAVLTSEAGEPRSTCFAEVCSAIEELMRMSAVPRQLQAHLVGDRVHPKYSMETVTGRWTSVRPNILGMGHRNERLLRDRDLILAEPGSYFLAADLSGIDARCVAGLSGDRGYAELFRPGSDVHAEMSRLFFGDDQHRQQAKAITHGINYGRGAVAIAEQTGMSVVDTEAMIAAYFGRYPGVRRWQDEMRGLARQGQMLPTGTGRFVAGDPLKAHTTAPARVAQACARDLAMVGLMRLVEADLLRYLRLFLHDEVVLSVPEAEDRAAQVLDLMSFHWAAPSGLVIPIVAHAAQGRGRRWSDLYSAGQVSGTG